MRQLIGAGIELAIAAGARPRTPPRWRRGFWPPAPQTAPARWRTGSHARCRSTPAGWCRAPPGQECRADQSPARAPPPPPPAAEQASPPEPRCAADRTGRRDNPAAVAADRPAQPSGSKDSGLHHARRHCSTAGRRHRPNSRCCPPDSSRTPPRCRTAHPVRPELWISASPRC